ncbi:MAG: 4Fe-4S binding protein [Deltaproteobacteria bacterium]|nr:4Fe-4S binding protein [Deltaproteobacteria bacterium]
MPFFINDNCIGCTICAQKCPVFCISGERKGIHVIDPEICIDCGVCAIYCPVDAINDPTDTLLAGIKHKLIPKAEVDAGLCTGCEYCVDICPFDCIKMVPMEGFHAQIAEVDRDCCVSCKLCETVCLKDSIVIPRATPFLSYFRECTEGQGRPE